MNKNEENNNKTKRLTRTKLRQEVLFQAFAAASGSSSAEQGYTENNAHLENTLNPLALEKKSRSWMDFFAVSFVADIEP